VTLYLYKGTTSWVYRAGSVGWVAESRRFVGVVRDKVEEVGGGLTRFWINKKVDPSGDSPYSIATRKLQSNFPSLEKEGFYFVFRKTRYLSS